MNDQINQFSCVNKIETEKYVTNLFVIIFLFIIVYYS